MASLEVMSLTVVKQRTSYFRKILVQLAGSCPALQTLDLQHVHGQLWFVPLFGQHFPEKNLTLKNVEATHNFKFHWPDNISVHALNIKGRLDDQSIGKVNKNSIFYFLN